MFSCSVTQETVSGQSAAAVRRLPGSERSRIPCQTYLSQLAPSFIAKAAESGEAGCVAVIDLISLKTVNDTLGKTAGDTLLEAAAECLLRCVRADGLMVRVGGDEFMLVLFGSRPEVMQRLRTMEDEVRAVWPEELSEAPSGVGIGLAWFPEEGTVIDNLLVHADCRMYIDKRNKRTAETLRLERSSPPTQ